MARFRLLMGIGVLGVVRLCSADILAVPGDFATIQGALNAAVAGDTIEVASGSYSEKLVFPSSGQAGAPIVLTAAPGPRPVIDGTGVNGANMVFINSRSFVTIEGFEIVNNLGVSDGSGIRIVGNGTDIVVRNNLIHEIRGIHAMGITVYGTDPQPISNLLIENNQIFDCDPAQSEALTLNGNVDGFEILGNLVRDVNSIGIDMIGGETDIQPNSTLVARNGVVRGNTVLRANANYEGGFGGGIYVDGGRDIVIENNWVAESDLGLEIGAENPGLTTRNVIVRNNVFSRNERAGIVFGGFEQAVGRVESCEFRGNTLWQNNTVGETGQGTYFVGGGIAEIWVQWASDNLIENNIVVAGPENIVVGSFDPGSSVNNQLDYNLYHGPNPANAEYSLNDQFFTGLAAWQAQTSQDPNSFVADPELLNPQDDDFHVSARSPARDAGDPAFLPEPDETDLDGEARLVGDAVDIGVDESGPGAIFSDGFESGDTSAWSGVTN